MKVSKKHKLLYCAVFLLLLFANSNIYSLEACASIQCDCEAFELNSWSKQCIKEQANQRKKCAIGIESNKVNACRLQGPEALPPVSKIDINSIEGFFAEQKVPIPRLKKHIKSSLWSLNDSLKDLSRLYNQKDRIIFRKLLKRARSEAGQVFLMQWDLANDKTISAFESSRNWKSYNSEQDKNIALLRKLISDMMTGLENSPSTETKSTAGLEGALSLVNFLHEQKIAAYTVLKNQKKLLQSLHKTAIYNAGQAVRLNQVNEKNAVIFKLRQWAAEQWYRSAYQQLSAENIDRAIVDKALVDYARAEEILDANTLLAVKWLATKKPAKLANRDPKKLARPDKYLNSLPIGLSRASDEVIDERSATAALDKPLPAELSSDKQANKNRDKELVASSPLSKAQAYINNEGQQNSRSSRFDTERNAPPKEKPASLLDRAKRRAQRTSWLSGV